MSNQQQQQAVKQQLRHPISLGSFDTSSQMYGADQPLSPTNIITSSNSREGLGTNKDNKQKQLKGMPQLVGLTTIEQGLYEKLQYSLVALEPRDLTDNYLNQLYEGNDQQIGQVLGKAQEQYSRIEMSIKLPYDLVIEQLEVQINKYSLFQKYLKVLRVDKARVSLEGTTDKSKLLIKGGFQDHNKKVIELNTCGISPELKFCFLFDKQAKPAQASESNSAAPPVQAQTEKLSDKIHNELYPLLQGSEEDIDELDDEVAMISNKKGAPQGEDQENERVHDSIEIDDIQFQLGDGNYFQNNSQSINNNNNNMAPPSKPKLDDQSPNQHDDDDINRNFNTFPRNYGDPPGADQGKQQTNQNNANALLDKSISKDTSQKNMNEVVDIFLLEQEIFGTSYNTISSSSQKQQGWHMRLLQKCISQIKIVGFNSNQLPAITNMTQFINASMMLKKEKMIEEAMDIDFMVGMLMISTKRNTQASEVLRKIQASYLNQIQKSQVIMVQQQNNHNKIINFQQQQHTKSQLLVKCAVIELLVAESMSQASQVNDKIFALKRMVELSTGKTVPIITYQQQIFYSEDPYTAMTRMLPKMLKFVILCMTHKKEVVRLSALKQLEFILETQGCSLDSIIVLILQALFRTYPGFQSSSSLTNQIKVDNENIPQSVPIKEPNSGFSTALKNLYSHVLDTYISVLSSISSHILHQLFYEVIMPFLVNVPTDSNTQPQNEIKVFAIKIAEKIITIGQGDLILSKLALDQFLTAVTSKKSQSETLFSSIKNLWVSIRSKVFTNYSQKGMKTLIEWLVEKMSQLSQGTGGQGGIDLNSSSNQDIAKLEISDEQLQQLSQLIDIVSLISVGRKKAEEEANSLIKIKQDYCQELYLLVNPLLFWLDFSVEREDRLNLFKAVYQTIKDVINNLPPKRVDLDVLQIMIPILQRVSEYLKVSSPSLNMLKFLDIVLIDIKDDKYCQQNPELQYFFLEMLNNFVSYISYCLYEEAFTVFDKLLAMCNDVVTEKVLTKCIVALVDKYTVKSKAHKNSLTLFMKSLMEVKMKKPTKGSKGDKMKQPLSNNNIDEDEFDNFEEEQLSVHSKNNYFEILTEFCFFNNLPPAGFSKNKDNTKVATKDKLSKIGELQRSPVDLHDLYIDKLQLFIDSLSMMNDLHINMFTSLITHPKFKVTLTNLLGSEETTIRLKCHEILEIVTNYYVQYCTSKTVYELAVPNSSSANGLGSGNDLSGGANKRKQQNEVMEVEFINHERLYLSQIVVQCVKQSLDAKNDSYLQFNSLILLDFLFQNLLPVPTYQNELFKNRGLSSQLSNNQNQSLQNNNEKAQQGLIDLETLEINEATLEYEVTEQRYINMRLNLIFKLWPYVQHALNSAWSNIRSICYGLICSMLKIDIRDYMPNGAGQSTSTQQYFLAQLKQLILPMLINLLSSKESESKAGGLNILGSFCGLSYDFSKIKISKNLEFFKKNTNFVTKRIWQLVFDLQDDWDITIKEASVVLIQLCAPRDKIIEFDNIKRAKENAGFTRMLNKYGLNTERGQSQLSSRSMANQYSIQSNDFEHCFQNPYATQHTNSQAELLNKQLLQANNDGEDLSILCCQDDQQFTGVASDIFQLLQNKKGIFDFDQDIQDNAAANQQQDRKLGLKSALSDYDQAGLDIEEVPEEDGGPQFQFFVDVYQDDQIQEIISIFRNDFKPPKNLWIEKNPSAAYNSPDYYGEIYSQAIEQYNQQQMHLQQQSQQQMQQQVSGSPKSATINLPGGKNANGLIGDALEDDLVKRYEREQQEREQLQKQGGGGGNNSGENGNDQQQQKDNQFMIFERHFEEDKEDDRNVEEQQKQDSSQQDQHTTNQLHIANNKSEQEYFPKQGPLTNQTQQQDKQGGLQQLHIIDEESQQNSKQGPNIQPQSQNQRSTELPMQIKNNQVYDYHNNNNNATTTGSSHNTAYVQNDKSDSIISIQGPSQTNFNQAVPGKQSADELIEEYERKINKTIQLLEEEKKKVQSKPRIGENQKNQQPISVSSTINQDAVNNMKSNPDIKTKREKLQENSNFVNVVTKDVSSKNAKKQAQSYLSELQKGHLTNIDNMKLIKQINNCFGDNLNLTAPVGAIKKQQKLNKSFENLFAQNKSNLKAQVQEAVKPSKKNLSSSPKRGSLSGKKNGQGKVSSQNRKKYLDQSKGAPNAKALYNMRDLNFFIKTIEKDLSEKFNKLNMKDFNSVPTTPTSILKKVEEQVKAQAQFKDSGIGKAYMSNTCPNIAQILGSLDTAQVSSKSNHALHIQDNSNLQAKYKEISATSNHTPSNIATHQNMFGGLNSKNFAFDAPTNNFDKSSFSKTQKLDLKDVTKGLFSYPYSNQGHQKEGNTQRDYSSENNTHFSKNKTSKFSPKHEDKYSNLMKQIKEKTSHTGNNPIQKRGKGSSDKNRNTMLQNPSSSSSQSKLNKSANIISSMPYKTSRKETLSKSFINMQMQAQNVSPHSKKNQKPILLNQLTSQGNSVLQSAGIGAGSSQTNTSQYSQSNNTTNLFDYNQGNQ